MAKLSYKDKVNIYKDKQKGLSYKTISLKYKIKDNHIKYLVRLIDKHGVTILKKYSIFSYLSCSILHIL